MATATYRNGRIGSAIHNQNEEVRKQLEHVDSERIKDNVYYAFDSNGKAFRIDGKFNLRQHEIEMYKHHYQDGIDKQNERYKQKGKSKYCKSAEDVYTSEKTKPMETVFQFSNSKNDDIPFEVKSKITQNAAADTINYMCQKYGANFKPLSFVVHNDESVPHVHFRATFGYLKDNSLVPNQTQALSEMGFERPDRNKPNGKHNCALISFTDEAREYFYTRCEERAKQLGYNITIDREPKSTSKRRKSKLEHQVAELESTLSQVQKDLTKASQIADTFLRDVSESLIPQLALEYLDTVQVKDEEKMQFIQNMRNYFHDKYVPNHLEHNEHYQEFKHICESAQNAISDVLEQQDDEIHLKR